MRASHPFNDKQSRHWQSLRFCKHTLQGYSIKWSKDSFHNATFTDIELTECSLLTTITRRTTNTFECLKITNVFWWEENKHAIPELCIESSCLQPFSGFGCWYIYWVGSCTGNLVSWRRTTPSLVWMLPQRFLVCLFLIPRKVTFRLPANKKVTV